MKKILNIKPHEILLILADHGLLRFMSDSAFIKVIYRARMGRKIDLKNPISYNEKLNWLKIHDRKPIYTTMVDKLAAKKFIANIIGEEYIVPVYGEWDSVDEIEWDKLPNQFVIKTNHDSGGVVICRDKSTFDFVAAKKILQKSLKTDYYQHAREWPYKNVKRKIFAEKFLNMGEALIDYKVMCFNQKAYAIQLNYESEHRHSQDFYDTNWNILPLSQQISYASLSGLDNKRPECFEQMLNMSEKLARDTYCLRVDWFVADGHLYSGELTFFDGAGFSQFDDYSMDIELGKHLMLPNSNGKG